MANVKWQRLTSRAELSEWRKGAMAALDGRDYDDSDRPYDIYARVFRFGVGVIQFVRTFPRTLDAIEVGKQLIQAGTSVGANMEEADAAESRADFIHKVRIACKEVRESRYWLRICLATDIGDPVQAKQLLSESEELARILSRIIKNAAAKQQALRSDVKCQM
jgi:four helix bundle protein